MTHLDGRHVLVLYDQAEPEAALGTVALLPAEARSVADVLHATVAMDQLPAWAVIGRVAFAALLVAVTPPSLSAAPVPGSRGYLAGRRQ
ncbi:hypothetical protein C6361_21610 [Plantactinospora sp. BC1]|uniref:hypothetical protein n=1 Tax=Plantactinospora sp. BC1 TaxID=2108470 RepID=UPI000D151C6F|nr:hypothetical protein [Plantactinospora sp. BC1]AVT31645.1 hypothetical protein C6361_21610 [Plantactinospora sp. BC1]